jgi:hypothetical protein
VDAGELEELYSLLATAANDLLCSEGSNGK